MSQELFSRGHWVLTEESAELPDGRVKKAIRAHLPNTAHILAFPTPKTVLLLREYRPFYGQYIWMIPSGHVDKEVDVALAAQRELREETGFKSQSMQLFFTVRHKETLDYTCTVFIARELIKDPLPQDADELIEVHELSLEEALQKVLQSPVQHSISALTLLRYLHDFGA